MRFVKASSLETLRVAYELGITFYDASYVVAAGMLDAVLVTDDGELRKRVRSMEKTVVELLGRRIETISSRELLGTG
ncbi:type II toxin-antitoxin system VapC family toxin [Hyperthermus butylicus]|uniref:PIN domain-containing protein n=1 Tax=Hyperthermus butylicus (strain DSM 5456 / JCM 9403 / PLM1-5) TaxID=415426 RepID=A2BMW1_HYPBU|nr:type II toxin-antitoxin system VapC family toxin [Hyperthermus butylicus]ABM81322.1 hypothetical protein Hbut_1500 [Hyperthermus butylicus DSM 5456]